MGIRDWFRRRVVTLRIENVASRREDLVSWMIEERSRIRYERQGGVMKPNHCRVKRWGMSERWIIVSAIDESMGWSGSQWVPLGGDVQICNFGSIPEAVIYAETHDLEIFVG